MMATERAEELRSQKEGIERELDLLSGKRGECSQCGEEKVYAAIEARICSKCWNEARIAAAREKFVHLIGLKVEDVIISSWIHPFQGLKLEGGYRIEVESDREGDAYLEISREDT